MCSLRVKMSHLVHTEAGLSDIFPQCYPPPVTNCHQSAPREAVLVGGEALCAQSRPLISSFHRELVGGGCASKGKTRGRRQKARLGHCTESGCLHAYSPTRPVTAGRGHLPSCPHAIGLADLSRLFVSCFI